MRKLLMLSLVALLVPVTSQAQFSVGLRVGYAPAMGDEVKDLKMSDTIKSQIPIQLDGLYKVTPDISVGGYFSYGFSQLNSDLSSACDSAGVSCSGSNMRLGVQARYTFNSVKAPMVPWAAAGLGYEWNSLKGEFGGVSVEATETGFEFLNLQLGGDYRVNEKFAIGPYVQFSVGQYSSIEGESISEKSMHQWLGFGIAGKYDL
jgi:hypothetical protein